MKKYRILLILILGSIALCLDAATKNTQKDIIAIKGLAHRLIPEQEKSFVFKLLTDTGKDQFQLESIGSKIVISGNNANSMAVGLNHYLKYYCHVEVGWYLYDTFKMPEKLPVIKVPVTIDARCKDRFFLNYCTFGYTMPWWKWNEWEHFIDWMALNGINLPLAITGQESIWYQVWTELGLTDNEVRSYFTGPAHLPWHRMLNIDYWQGPLPHSWLNSQLKLQQQIVAREREFNMRPVLPAFAGHVPQELKRIYPNAKITKLGAWAGFPDENACSFLDPMDSLFVKIQKKFLDTEIKLYGTDHIYGIDLFNELTPPSWEPEYLQRVSRQVYEALEQADSKAVWLQMTWLFYNERDDWTNDRVKPYVTAFPADRSLLLDYYCERQEVWQRTEKYFGVPYIWCYLGNFGGNTMLAGNIDEVNKRLENTFINGGDNFAGIGSTLEGFDCNPFIYEYVFEKAWNFDIHKHISQWVEALADQRVGKIDINGRKAWKLLIDSVYTASSTPGQCPLINIRPTFGKYKTYYANPHIKYDNKNLLDAIELLLAANGTSHAYFFDVANITRQLLSNYYQQVFKDYEKAYNDRDRQSMKAKEKEMIDIMDDIDRLLASQSAFLVGKWISDARSWGVNHAESNYFESNARNLITTWGDKDMLLNDYASRTWAGLTKTFYAERWKMFFTAVDSALNRNETFDDEHYNAYKAKVTLFEKDWWEKRMHTFNSNPVGDSKIIAKELLEKYKAHILGKSTIR
ncbi:alpha-N-acetylglucosaminidase [Bacteroidaceae bacterium HV4-6-C5C]|nr:alpha-N-acetylglucosaminidase [Bacteroidaceae bacterium HV4-6-C5C]